MLRLMYRFHTLNRNQNLLIWCLGFGVWFLIAPSHALKPAIVHNDTTHIYSLSSYREYDHLEYLEDKAQEYTIRDVSSPAFEDRFVVDSDAVPGFRKTDSAFWVRFQLRNESETDRRWLLDTRRIRTFVLRQIIHFGLIPENLRTEYSSIAFYISWAGLGNISSPSSYQYVDRSPSVGPYLIRKAPVDTAFAAREFPGRYFEFPIPDSTDWNRPFYIRFNHENALSKRLKIWTLH